MGLDWLLFLSSTTLVSLSPGLNSLAVVQTSLASGFPQSLRVIAGQQASLATQMMLVAIGVAQASTVFLWWLKVAGACYLIYLSGLFLLAARAAPEHAGFKPGSAKAAGFWRGYFVNTANPKAMLFQAAFVPQFLNAEQSIGSQYLVLGSAMLAIECLVMMSYALAAASAKRFVQSPQVAMSANALCGLIFASIGVGMLVLIASS